MQLVFVPQPVLHVTNLAHHVGETELTTFFSQLGSVAFATLLPSAGTALVEMSSIQEAEKVIAFGQSQPVSRLLLLRSLPKLQLQQCVWTAAVFAGFA